MLVKRKNHMYTSKRKMIHGHGYVQDTLKSFGSYIAQNKDLLAKPLLGAAGELGAFALTEGGKALIRKLAAASAEKNNSSSSSREVHDNKMSPESRKIINSIITGSGIKKI